MNTSTYLFCLTALIYIDFQAEIFPLSKCLDPILINLENKSMPFLIYLRRGPEKILSILCTSF